MTEPPPAASGRGPTSGHPEPEPVPGPEPEPPQPIPPPDPVPPPEPPHATSPPGASAETVPVPAVLAPPIWAGPSPQYPQWQVPLVPAPPKRRGGLWVSLALTVIVLLCAGGAASAYFLISNADTGTGAKDPATAVNKFMTAVYTQQDADVAMQLVCRQARDKQKLAAKIKQIDDYANGYAGPQFRWSDPVVRNQTGERAVVQTTLQFSTSDEKQSEQPLTFTMIHKKSWQVCDVIG